jgi:D-alanyl-D-alanine endopeptidase (penicillin-binding protein 7)
MAFQFQALALILVIFVSLTITRADLNRSQFRPAVGMVSIPAAPAVQKPPANPPNLSFQAVALRAVQNPVEIEIKRGPVRNWEVLDLEVNAGAVLIESLDDGFPFFYHQVYRPWPMASLTKLLTAVVASEDIGINKKIEITPEMITTEGNNGGFQAGEIYTAFDLLKIMVITSSNDAAAAFEYYYGKDAFVARLNEKARELKMSQTRVTDASGLSNNNMSSAADIVRLLRYVLERHPEVLNWSRLPSLLVQPINRVESRMLQNINSLVEDKNFWGGKTGTSLEARENLAAIFTFNTQRFILVILGSYNRIKNTKELFEWVGRAYKFQ